jgi:hypothetical protein
MNQVKPFSPADARAHVENVIPSEVISAVNQLLAENYDEGGIILKQQVIRDRALRLMYAEDEHGTFDYKWLNFEPAYEIMGWDVTYTKPDYTESFDPYFTFTPTRHHTKRRA